MPQKGDEALASLDEIIARKRRGREEGCKDPHAPTQEAPELGLPSLYHEILKVLKDPRRLLCGLVLQGVRVHAPEHVLRGVAGPLLDVDVRHAFGMEVRGTKMPQVVEPVRSNAITFEEPCKVLADLRRVESDDVAVLIR